MRTPPALILALLAGVATTARAADDPAAWSIATAPPVVVRTTPEAGTPDVDPATKAIRVRFSKPMMDRSWSFAQVADGSFPKLDGEPRYEPDGTTCVLPVALEPGRTYVLWLNSERFRNFKDRGGRPAVPYLLVFRTK
jgi:RNA polymerase sigma-70 factor (ECF subfamily)